MRRPDLVATIRRTDRLAHGLDHTLDFERAGEVLPATWLVPDSGATVPAVLLLHGFSSSREVMAQAVGKPLLAEGVASLALDLPYHGERGATGGEMPRNPLALVGAWRSAVAEARAAAAWLAAQSAVDEARLGVVGYSLGGFLALMSAADEPLLQVVALAAAGDLPDNTPYARMARAAVDPLKAAKRLDGRPLLLLNGRRDRTTRPAQAERLFEAAGEPKSLIWYEGGHWPPPAAIGKVVRWMAGALKDLPAQRVKRQAG